MKDSLPAVKLLGLLRHAKSSWDDVEVRDFDRPLNKRGHKGAALMGRHIRDHGVHWDRIVASPALRVRETLDSVAGTFKPMPPVAWDNRIYLASPGTLIEVLHETEGDPAALLLVGHNPGLQEVLCDLASEDTENPLLDEASQKFPTAAFAVMELDVGQWADVRPGCARLVHFIRPRDLDAALGPQVGD